jgi:hypothetical protein
MGGFGSNRQSYPAVPFARVGLKEIVPSLQRRRNALRKEFGPHGDNEQIHYIDAEAQAKLADIV